MNQPNSSTSSSDSSAANSGGGLGAQVWSQLVVTAWTLFFLALIDIGINYVFRYPTRLDKQPSSLIQYFDYGRSIEGKIRRQIGLDDDSSSNLARSGWLESKNQESLPTKPGPGHDLLVAAYGMSFSQQISHALASVDPRVEIRFIGGPSGPANYTYAAYEEDRHKHQAKVVVLGLLASSIKGMGSISGMTWQFEGPSPYTFPKFTPSKKGDGLVDEEWPPARSLQDFREILNDPTRWNSFLEQLRKTDDFYEPFLFNQSFLDESVLVRLLRRAWAKYQHNLVASRIHTSKGYVEDSPYVAALQILVTQFAKTAREDGRLPIVLLIDNQGFFDHLDRILVPTLERDNIPYISTNEICPSADATNFAPDGHFNDASNLKIAKAIQLLLEKQGVLSKPKQGIGEAKPD